MSRRAVLGLLALALPFGVDAAPQPPEKSLAARLLQAVDAEGERWIGWTFPRAERPGHRILAGFPIQDAIDDGGIVAGRRPSGLAARLERLGEAVDAPRRDGALEVRPVAVLLRYEGRRLERLGAADLDLAPDPGGRLVWLGAVDLDASLDALLGLTADAVEAEGRRLEAIGLHDRPRATAALLRALAERLERRLRVEAVEGLGRQSSAEAFTELVAVARRDRDVEVRAEAAESLGESANPGATAALIALLAEPGPSRVRREAVEALGERGDAEAVSELRRRIWEDADGAVQAEAVESLAEALAEEAIVDLIDISRRHRDEQVRREAIESLGELAAERADSRARRALEMLVER